MKSSAMRRLLLEAGKIESPIPEAELRFYMEQGSFRVREQLYALIARHSNVVAELSADSRLGFMSAHLVEGFGKLKLYQFTERLRELLAEIVNLGVCGEARRELLQGLLGQLEPIFEQDPTTAKATRRF